MTRVAPAGARSLGRPAKLFMAALFGTVMMLSFAPGDAWWLTPFCLAGLFMLAPGEGALGAGWLGLVFGLGWLGSGVWWLYPGLAGHTDAGPALALALTLVLACYQALFPALALAAFAALARRCPQRIGAGAWRWSAGASLWMLAEWIRATLFGGFPWLLSGTAHAAAPLGALAPWVGVMGVGWINAFVALALADASLRVHEGLLARKRAAWAEAALQLGVTLGLVALACALLPLQRWTARTGQRLAVRLIQGDMAQRSMATPAGLAQAAGRYAAMAGSTSADLTVMPETALPLAWSAMPPPVLAQWRALAGARRTALVVGAFGADGARRMATNSALALLPGGAGPYDYRYDKVHLVPFGEQTWPWSAWLTGLIYREFDSLEPGAPGQAPLILEKGRVALGICFESLFDVATANKAAAAGVLVNLTNFGWFDGSYAAAQHLQAGQMRARETGRPFVQVGNTGGTAIAGPDGELRATLPAEVTAVLDAEVELMQGMTPFMRFGNGPLLGASLILLLLAARRPAASDVEVAPTAVRT